MHQQKIYFPNLNGLRFFAALLVILHHIEQIKHAMGMDAYWEKIRFFGFAGKFGVFFFFVLSGFLITYLLLAEEKQSGTIRITRFYIRRMLRIWPLYFAVIILAFLVWPQIPVFNLPGYSPELVYSDLAVKLILFVLFLPNLVLALLGPLPYAAHTWSIGTEEQFYLAWPVLLKCFRKHRLRLMATIIFIYLLVSGFLMWSGSDLLPYKKVIKAFWSSFHIDCMAIGGIYALLLFEKSKWLRILTHVYLFYSVLLILGVLIVNGVFIPYFTPEFYAVLGGLLILNFAAKTSAGISLENPVLHYLGKISYGLYMFHPVGVMLALVICRNIHITTNWLIYPLSLGLTIAMAAVSYSGFEKFFLRFKPRFTTVISGEEAGVKAAVTR